MKKCAVIGSINMDLVLRVPRFPRPGESLIGSSFKTIFGGKGANQAVALGKLGIPVRMAGQVGGDAFGEAYCEHFQSCGVDVRAVQRAQDLTTAVADIFVNDAGENFIGIDPGANLACTPEWLDRILPGMMDCDIFLLQLEIPLESVFCALKRLHAAGKTVILDPAPAAPLPEEALACVDYLTPNETELRTLTGSLPEASGTEERIRALIGGSDRVVVHKSGAHGAYIGTRHGITHVPGYPVKAVDTTAAGDTFNAGLAAGLAMGRSLEESVRLANAAGALAVTALGAQAGMPTLEAAESLMANSASTLR